MSKTLFVVMLMSVAACGSKDKDKGGDKGADKGGDKGGGASSAEATIMLKKIADAAKEEQVTSGGVPTGKVGPTPAEPCCGKPDKKCKPDAALWGDPLWKRLGFSIEESFAFQYAYEGDGKSFTAKAIGCGGAKTYTVTGSSGATGKLMIELGEQ